MWPLCPIRSAQGMLCGEILALVLSMIWLQLHCSRPAAQLLGITSPPVKSPLTISHILVTNYYFLRITCFSQHPCSFLHLQHPSLFPLPLILHPWMLRAWLGRVATPTRRWFPDATLLPSSWPHGSAGSCPICACGCAGSEGSLPAAHPRPDTQWLRPGS